MTEAFSPAAQAIVQAFNDKYELYPFDDNWQGQCIAAALRAAALYCKRDGTILLSLADELEGADG